MLQNYKDVVEILKNKGWICQLDEAGDHYCLLDLGDRQLSVIPTFKSNAEYKKVTFIESVSTPDFTCVVNTIFTEHKSKHVPLITPWNSEFKLKGALLTSADILSTLDGIIAWAKSQDIDKALESCSKSCPDRPGLKQLYHLAALAMAGEVKILKNYYEKFLQSNTLNFVPMITIDVIGRTLELAENKAKSK